MKPRYKNRQISIHQLGRIGELIAAQKLIEDGHLIRAQRFRTSLGEVDLISEDDQTLIFTEVKTRRSFKFGHAIESVDPFKLLRLTQVAQLYCNRFRWKKSWRIDVIGIDLATNGKIKTIEHLQDVTQ